MGRFKNIVAVSSGKGGVGKSTVAASLGLAAAKAGLNVGIIDADLHGFSIPRMLGESEIPHYNEDDKLLPGFAQGIKIVSMGYFVESNPVIWRAPLYSGALNQFINDFEWGNIDLMLVDMPPGTGDMPLNVMQRLPQAKLLVISTPQPTAAEVSVRVAVMAQKMNFGVLGVIENMSWFECDCGRKHYLFGQGGGQKMADELGVQLLAQLPLREEIRERADAGQLQLMPEVEELFARLRGKLDL